MSAELVAGLVLLWSLWLCWHGRADSPRRRRDAARWDALMAQAIRDKEAQR